jgi:hypothetical protein
MPITNDTYINGYQTKETERQERNGWRGGRSARKAWHKVGLTVYPAVSGQDRHLLLGREL